MSPFTASCRAQTTEAEAFGSGADRVRLKLVTSQRSG